MHDRSMLMDDAHIIDDIHMHEPIMHLARIWAPRLQTRFSPLSSEWALTVILDKKEIDNHRLTTDFGTMGTIPGAQLR